MISWNKTLLLVTIPINCDNGLSQLIATTTRITLYSATVSDHMFPNHLSHNRHCGILDADSTDHFVTLVKLPFSREECYDTETVLKIFFSFIVEM